MKRTEPTELEKALIVLQNVIEDNKQKTKLVRALACLLLQNNGEIYIDTKDTRNSTWEDIDETKINVQIFDTYFVITTLNGKPIKRWEDLPRNEKHTFVLTDELNVKTKTTVDVEIVLRQLNDTKREIFFDIFVNKKRIDKDVLNASEILGVLKVEETLENIQYVERQMYNAKNKEPFIINNNTMCTHYIVRKKIIGMEEDSDKYLISYKNIITEIFTVTVNYAKNNDKILPVILDKSFTVKTNIKKSLIHDDKGEEYYNDNGEEYYIMTTALNNKPLKAVIYEFDIANMLNLEIKGEIMDIIVDCLNVFEKTSIFVHLKNEEYEVRTVLRNENKHKLEFYAVEFENTLQHFINEVLKRVSNL